MKLEYIKIQLANQELRGLPFSFKRFQYSKLASVYEEIKLLYYDTHLCTNEMRNAIPIRKICKIKNKIVLMSKYSETDKFILSSSCRVVKGAKRSVLIDYQRIDIRITSNDYADLISLLNRQTISIVKDKIKDNFQEQFEKFLNFLISNEFGFIVKNIDLYPEISNELYDEHIMLLDGIIEIHKDRYNYLDFKEIIKKFDDLLCGSVQIRFISKATAEFINELLKVIKDTNISYVEMHISEDKNSTNFYHSLINDNPKLTEVFLYGSMNNESIEVINEKEGHYQISLGSIHYKTTLLNESICGVITFEDLTFGELNMHNLLRSHNGCLYKKLTIDSYGNIKNCPSMKMHFGHHSKT